jgi:hypothetical protein
MPDYFQPLSCRLLSLLIFFALLLISFRYWLFFFHFHYSLFIDSLISLFDFLSLRYFRRFRHAALHAAATGAFAAAIATPLFSFFIIIFVFHAATLLFAACYCHYYYYAIAPSISADFRYCYAFAAISLRRHAILIFAISLLFSLLLLPFS